MDKTKALIETIMVMQNAMNNEFQAIVTKGNKSAARRARLLSLEMAKVLKEFRKVSIDEV